jgi:hypothetical protein
MQADIKGLPRLKAWSRAIAPARPRRCMAHFR